MLAWATLLSHHTVEVTQSLCASEKLYIPAFPKPVLPHISYRVSQMPGLDPALLENGEHRDGRFTVLTLGVAVLVLAFPLTVGQAEQCVKIFGLSSIKWG